MQLPDDLDRQGHALRRLATRLVADAHLAEDVVQEAWLRTADRPMPQRPEVARSLMRRIVRGLAIDTRRARARRARVEQPIVDDEVAMEPAERGLDLQLELLAAVRSLPEPYRSTVWQRYFEGLPPRTIAAAGDVPVKTVKTRLHRALAMLRERLDAANRGDVRAWVLPMLPLVSSEWLRGVAGASEVARGASSAGSAGVSNGLSTAWSLLMKTTALRVAPVILLIAGVLVLAWSPWADAGRAEPDTVARSGRVGVASVDEGATRSDETDTDAGVLAPARTVVESGAGEGPSAAAAVNELVVQVLWRDRDPAPGVGVALRRVDRGLPRKIVDQGVSDDAGRVTFPGLAGGRYRVRTDRGEGHEVDVVSDESTTTELVLEDGVDVDGVVVDAEDRPVANARIWLQTSYSDWAGGRVLATADADGRFSLRAIPGDLSLGALAADGASHERSALVDLDLVDKPDGRAEVRLVLGAHGARITGVVSAASTGLPLEGALVALGKRESRLEFVGDRVSEAYGPRVATSDAQGRFDFDGVAPGEVFWSVRYKGHGLLRGRLAVEAGTTATLPVNLETAATVFGVVVDEAGKPYPGVAVHAFDSEPGTDFIQGGQIDFDEVFDHVGTRTAADGSFRLSGVTAGSAHLLLQHVPEKEPGWGDSGGGIPYLQEVLELAPGEEREWNPTLGEGRVIEGRVLYRDGHPLTRQFVTVRTSAGEAAGTLVTDGEGRFRFVCLTEPIYHIYVQVFGQPKDSPPVEKSGIVPGHGPVEIRATFDKPVEQAKAVVVGQLLDAGNRIANPHAASVLLVTKDRSWHTSGLDDAGRFEFEHVTPGELRLVVMYGDIAVFHGEPFQVAPAARHDVGTLTTTGESAVLRIVVERGAETAGHEPSLYLSRVDGRRGATIKSFESEEVEVGNLQPGDYRWAMYCRGLVSCEGTVTLSSDRPAEIQLPLMRGGSCKFDVRYAQDVDLGDVTVVYEQDGKEFRRRTYSPESAMSFRRYHVGMTLPPGEWRAVMTTTTGLRAEAAFSISSFDDVQSPVLELR